MKKAVLVVCVVITVILAEGVSFSKQTNACLWHPDTGLRDLGTLGGTWGSAHAVNDVGQVVGDARTAEPKTNPFLWDPASGMQNLGPLGIQSGAYGINNSGVVVGYSRAFGRQASVRWDPQTGIEDLGGILAVDINNAGQITCLGTWDGASFTAFLWDPQTGKKDLEKLSTWPSSRVTEINNSGVVVGSCYNPNGGASRACIWVPGSGVEDLGTLGGAYASAKGINDQGQVVGSSDTADGEHHAFLWDSAHGMRDLGTLGGNHSIAVGINDYGQVVGWSYTQNGERHPYIWDADNGMQDLWDLARMLYANDINNAGQVVGNYEVPEPATLSLLALGGLAMLRRRRR